MYEVVLYRYLYQLMLTGHTYMDASAQLMPINYLVQEICSTH